MQSLLARHLSRPLRKLWDTSPKRRPHSLLSFVTQVLIQHRASKDALTLVDNILRSFRSRFVYLNFDEHGSVTANTQTATNTAFLRWIIHDASQYTFYDWRSITFPFSRILWSVWVLLGLQQKHIHGNRVSVSVEWRLRKWTSHFKSIRMLGISMQDSPSWIPSSVPKSINMPKVLRSYSN